MKTTLHILIGEFSTVPVNVTKNKNKIQRKTHTQCTVNTYGLDLIMFRAAVFSFSNGEAA